MQEIRLLEVTDFNDFEAENLLFAKLYRNKHISLSLDKYVVGVKTPMMYKNRPEEGKEILIPFSGKLKIITEDQERVCDPAKNGLSVVIIDGNTKRQFENVGEVDALVLAIFAPPFHIDEIKDFLNSINS